MGSDSLEIDSALIIFADGQSLSSGECNKCLRTDRFLPPRSAGRKGIKVLSVGIDTHLKMHQVEVQNHDRKVMWRGQM